MIPIPTEDNVVLIPIPRETTTKSGIHTLDPHTLERVPNRGIVERVGPGRITKKGDHIPMQLKAGDEVIFSKMTGSEITFNGKTWIVVPERDVLSIVVPE